MGYSIKFNSFNARGLSEGSKRRTIFQCLKQTHTTLEVESKWRKEWGGNIYFSHGTHTSRGVAILFPKGLDIEVTSCSADNDGRFLLLKMFIEEQEFILINVYAPTKDEPVEQVSFINYISNELLPHLDGNLMIGGDFNCCLDPAIDKQGGVKEKQSPYAKEILAFNEQFNTLDVWRILNPEEKKYTWLV